MMKSAKWSASEQLPGPEEKKSNVSDISNSSIYEMKSDFCREVLNQSVFKTFERKIIYNTSKRWSISLWKFHLQTVSKWVSWDNDSWKVEWPCCLCSIREALLAHLQLQQLQVHTADSTQLTGNWSSSGESENPKSFYDGRESGEMVYLKCKNLCNRSFWWRTFEYGAQVGEQVSPTIWKKEEEKVWANVKRQLFQHWAVPKTIVNKERNLHEKNMWHRN